MESRLEKLEVKIQQLESNNDEDKLRIIQLEEDNKKKDEAIQSLRKEIEILKKVVHASDNMQNQDQIAKVSNETMSIIDHLVWGPEYYQEDKKSLLLYPSYSDWYQAVTIMMGDKREVYKTEKYFFVKKEFDKCSNSISFVSTRKESEYGDELDNEIMVDCFNRPVYTTVSLFLLHPTDFAERLQFDKGDTHSSGYEWWRVQYVTDEYFFGDKHSVIVFGILK